MPFDKTAITRACIENNLDFIDSIWLDSAKIVRRTWEEYSYHGYGLANIADFLGIEFNHHDALEDAITAGKIAVEACLVKNLTIEQWCDRVNKPLHTYKGGSTTIKIDGDPEGSLFGENIVFTGELMLTRHDSGTIAAELGCNVSNSVTKKTTMLVVGIQEDYKLVPGQTKSSKHRKAGELIKKGQKIRILSEKDFLKMAEFEDI